MEEKNTRQLAAVMFTDIVGYTALMQEDEDAAVIVRTRHRKVFQQQHEIHQGKIIQYYGDGTLSVFKSAIEAAKCAIEIQRLLQEGDPVLVRIGLHMGDIVFNKTEVYGDGVNFASRIESMGVAGAILLSGKLNDELKNHSGISTTSLGLFKLKNIEGLVEVFAITNKGIIVPQPLELKGKQTLNKTIAVLPFVNMSASAENEYFSDGITEEITNALAKIKTLRVTSRISSFFYKNKSIPVKQIGQELNVSAILEGSVRLSGDTIRITAQLIQAEEDFHFWSETWDRKLVNIFEIQDEISLLIADKLREHFGHFEIQDHLVQKQTASIDAYEYFLKAKFHSYKWNPDDKHIAISYFEKALAIDPQHAESYLGLADCYGFLATTGFMPYQEAWTKSAELTAKALSVNDQLPGVYYQLAQISFFTACDYKTAYIQTTKALELKANYVDAQQFLSFLYIIAGEKEKAREHLEIALGIDPKSQETEFYTAYFHYMLEDYATALSLLDKCIEHNPKNIPAQSVKCYCLLKLGRYDEVLHYIETAPPGMVGDGDQLGYLAMAYAIKNDRKLTENYIAKLLEQAEGQEGFRAHSFLFLVHAIIGEKDKAFEWVTQSLESKSSLLLFNFADPLVNAIKDDPRYLVFHKKIYQTDVAIEPGSKKKQLLDAEAIINYTTRLLAYIDEKKPYLDPDLSLRSLAGQIGIHPNQLSWLINESMGKNFNEFINKYRVDAFKSFSTDPKNAHLTLIGLAYDSGFNSKTVFNVSFKKETGITPKEFLKLPK